VLTVIVPLAQEPPDVAGATLWVLLAATGIAVVLVATKLERWRSRIGAGMHRLGACCAVGSRPLRNVAIEAPAPHPARARTWVTRQVDKARRILAQDEDGSDRS
jgi:hypothetical protein